MFYCDIFGYESCDIVFGVRRMFKLVMSCESYGRKRVGLNWWNGIFENSWEDSRVDVSECN